MHPQHAYVEATTSSEVSAFKVTGRLLRLRRVSLQIVAAVARTCHIFDRNEASRASSRKRPGNHDLTETRAVAGLTFSALEHVDEHTRSGEIGCGSPMISETWLGEDDQD